MEINSEFDKEIEFTWDEIVATASGLSQYDVKCMFYSLRDVYDFREDGVYRKFERDIEQSDLDLTKPPSDWRLPKTIPKKYWKPLNIKEELVKQEYYTTEDPTDKFEFYVRYENIKSSLTWTPHLNLCMVGPSDVGLLPGSFTSMPAEQEPDFIFPLETISNHSEDGHMEPLFVKPPAIDVESKEYFAEEDLVIRLVSSIRTVKGEFGIVCNDKRYHEILFGAAILCSEGLSPGKFIYLSGFDFINKENFKTAINWDDFPTRAFPPDAKIIFIPEKEFEFMDCPLYHIFEKVDKTTQRLGDTFWVCRRADCVSEVSVYCEPAPGLIMDYEGRLLQVDYNTKTLPTNCVNSKFAIGTNDKILDYNFKFVFIPKYRKSAGRFKLMKREPSPIYEEFIRKAEDRRPLLISDALNMRSDKFVVLKKENLSVANSIFELDWEGNANFYFKGVSYRLDQERLEIGRVVVSCFWNGKQLQFIDIEESETTPSIGLLYTLARIYGCSVVNWEILKPSESWIQVERVFPQDFVQVRGCIWGSLKYISRYVVTTGRELRAFDPKSGVANDGRHFLVDRAFMNFTPTRYGSAIYPMCNRDDLKQRYVADKYDLEGDFDIIRNNENIDSKLRCSIGFASILTKYAEVGDYANLNRVWCAIGRSTRRYKCRIRQIIGPGGSKGMENILNIPEIANVMSHRVKYSREGFNQTKEEMLKDIDKWLKKF